MEGGKVEDESLPKSKRSTLFGRRSASTSKLISIRAQFGEYIHDDG